MNEERVARLIRGIEETINLIQQEDKTVITRLKIDVVGYVDKDGNHKPTEYLISLSY